ncbi:Trans-resveratrol di-O-methyltransferase [Linum perenne]
MDAERATELLEAQTKLWSHSLGNIKSLAVQCAIELGIPDVIHSHGGAIKLAELTAELGISHAKAPFLGRLMRMLVHLGYLTEGEGGGGYTLTPLCDLLVKTNPFDARSLVFAANDPIVVDPWRHMSSWFRTNDAGDHVDTPFALAHNGKKMYQVTAEKPQFGELVNGLTGADSWLISKVLVAKCKSSFEGLSSLVDVGGNTGTISKAIAQAFPSIKCTVFDLPHVVSGLEEGESVGNLNYVSGDMFKEIPSADAVILKVLLDWGDEACMQILKQCKKAVTSKQDGKPGKVMIIDFVLGHNSCNDRASTETMLLVDMLDMVCLEGTIRTEQQWSKLFHEAGFSTYTMAPLCGLRAFIEVFP